MFDHAPAFGGGGCLESSQHLLVDAILSLEEANNSHQNLVKTPATRKSLNNDIAVIAKNIKQALDRLSKMYILLFGPQCSEDSHSFSRWISQNRKVINGFLGDNSDQSVNKIFDIVLGDGSFSEGVIEIESTTKTEVSSPPPCATLTRYLPSVDFAQELKECRRLLELRFESRQHGVPRVIVEKVASLEVSFYITRDPTTDAVWNIDHQQARVEVFQESDVGKAYRAKCICKAEEGAEVSHTSDPYCPKNTKDEDTPTPSEEEKTEEKKEGSTETTTTGTPAEEKVDPSEKIRSKELMAEIMDMVGPQHVKDHFRKIKEIVSSSYKEEKPWEGKFFGAVLMGPASTGKDKIAKRYGKYLISCGIATDNRIDREASYIIENDKLEDYFTRLANGGVLSIENAHLLVSYKHKDKLALNYLLEQTEKTNGKVTLILHGEEQGLREFLAKTKSTKLFPHILALNEFKGEDTLTMLRSGMENWFGEKTEVEGGWDGLYMRIAARRIAKKKDVDVPEAIGTLVKQIYQRQRKRVSEAKKEKGESDKVTKSDIVLTKDEEKNESSEKKDENAESASITEGDSETSSKPEEVKDGEKQKVKVQEVASQPSTASSESKDEPKSQAQITTAIAKTEPAVSSVSVGAPQEKTAVGKSEVTATDEKSIVQAEVEKLDPSVEVPKPESESSTGQSTPISELEEESSAEGVKLPAEDESKIQSTEKKDEVSETKTSVLQEPKVEEKPTETETKVTDTKSDSEEKVSAPDAPKAEDPSLEPPKQPNSTLDSKESKEEEIDEKTAAQEIATERKEASAENLAAKASASPDPKEESKKEDEANSDSNSDSGDSDSSSDTASTTVTTPDTNEEKVENEDDIEDPEDYTFTKDDILGPAPTNKVMESEAWKKLHKLTGLKKVKESLLNFLELAKANYQRELQEKPLLEFTFNRLFLGPPGTGKTVVAKLYGQILAQIGVLSKGELVVKNASDLIGKYIGDSETNTREALKEGDGNVLVIDEAYMLYTSDGVSNTTDCFRQGIIDTLVGGIQNIPGEDRCVLLLGYEDQMRNFLTESNPGLIRRFPLEDAFIFESFNLSELKEILLMKLSEYGLEASPEAIKVAMDVLSKARTRLNFGNGGAVENLITKAKSAALNRIIALPEDSRPEDAWLLEPRDFDAEFDRHNSATENLKKLFADVVGCDDIVQKFSDYQQVCQAMKARDIDPRGYIPTNFIFKGPPGTGKTTTARKIAQVYYDMGFLSEATVVECSVTDLIGQYLGQTGPKTVKALERGLGKVLFIDEAYRLGERSSYSSEAVSELVDCLTKPKFLGNLIVVLAGYEDEMNHLLTMNPGLASRFPEEIIFELLPAKESLQILTTKLSETGISLPLKDTEEDSLERVLRSLAQTPNWGNARDVETLSRAIARKVFLKSKGGGELICDFDIALEVCEDTLAERRARDGVINVAGMYY